MIYISQLLEKAEYCKGVNNSLEEQKVPIRRTVTTNNRGQIVSPVRNSVQVNRNSNPNPELANLERAIEGEIVDRSLSVKWEDIAGLERAKEMLREAIILPSQFPHIFTGLRAPPKGIMLFGPPGTGKTMLAKAVASQCQATFLSVSSATLTSKNFGDAEKLVRALFSVARRLQPSVIFIDEVDSILGSRSDSQHEASRRLETEFLVQMDGVSSNSDDRVIVIAATNRPQEIDEAVRRRLAKRVYIDLPDNETRNAMVMKLMENLSKKLSPKDLDFIVKHTNFYSGSDMTALCKEAAMGPVRNLKPDKLSKGEIPPISLKHFKEALKVIRPSVSK
eukprot:CAMPEP_0202948656 /NCGR_PEP_ID=MMETSP1395-20130829/14031_1 /ASSEMBLY_ACC=CAM_ASM_000871 /TAXON_ID=5961 /ORGANISM="Blepharisma japonicum, Strain Stock R1072" /LENGTH=334 /DNA_ID=CAMNT_0049650907 /DNA_START=98 /DNA_END=1099 /DNA_ORIENTATION=+